MSVPKMSVEFTDLSVPPAIYVLIAKQKMARSANILLVFLKIKHAREIQNSNCLGFASAQNNDKGAFF